MDSLPSCYSLLQPELMAIDQLSEILRCRSVPVSMIENKTKDELVQVFKVIACPLPQREFRRAGGTWREKLWADSLVKNKEGSKIKNISKETSSSSTTSRLKPAIESSHKHKIIRLNTENNKTSSCDGKRKRIKIDFSDPNEKSTATPKLISKKRSNSSETDSTRKKIAG